MLRTTRKVETALPLLLNPATNITFPSNDTIIVPIDRLPGIQTNRDYYRFGVGVDLIELFGKIKARPTSQ